MLKVALFNHKSIVEHFNKYLNFGQYHTSQKIWLLQ